MSEGALNRIRGALRAHPGHRGGVLLAVSGGPDSVLLLAACAPLAAEGVAIEVAWIDHGVRPETPAEGALVRGLTEARGLTFHARQLSLSPGPGFEARARDARERALEALRVERGLALIATGHTATDQAETLLMRLSRGAALRGAAGIRERRGALVRPMLSLTRAEVRAAVHALGLSSCEDPMNHDPQFLRVRIRHEVLPALEAAVGFDVAPRLARFAALAAEDDDHLEAEAARALGRLALRADPAAPLTSGRAPEGPSREPLEGGVPPGPPGSERSGALDAVGLRALSPALRRRVLHRWIRERVGPLDHERLVSAIAALEAGRRCELREGVLLACEGGLVRLVAQGKTRAPPTAARLGPPLAPLEIRWDGRWRIGLSVGPRAPDREHCHPLAQLDRPLEVRARGTGDRVRLSNGHLRRVADVMVDAKVPRELRADWPLIAEMDGPVIWVPGAQRSPRSAPAVAWLWAEALR